MFKELDVGGPCSVTKELVHEVAHMFPEVFIDKDGQIILLRVLWSLGFKITTADEYYLRGVHQVKGVIIRNNKKPSEVYTTDLYNGTIRREDYGIVGGKVKYSNKNWHPMKDLYDKFEVLQPKDLFKYFTKNDMRGILEIGTNRAYLDGFKNC